MIEPRIVSRDLWEVEKKTRPRRIQIVIGLLSLVVAVAMAVPVPLRERIRSNEVSAIRLLKRLSGAQEEFKSSATLDRDEDGTGEYGYLQDLAAAGRIGREAGDSARENGGTAILRGFRIRVFLPFADGSGRGESSGPAAFSERDANHQEWNWVSYAWPDRLGISGDRAFALNQEGRLYQTSNTFGWDGAFGPETGAEAFESSPDMTGPMDVGGPGSTPGQNWVPG